MPQYVASITVDDVITALGEFLQPFVGTSQIIRAQQNRVAPPLGAYVELTELRTSPLETYSITDDAENTQVIITGPTRVDIQVDFYGPSSGDQCKAVGTIYRTPYSTGEFPDGIKPLYCSDGQQSPLVTGEEQYESRWTITASLQYNPAISLPQQSANKLSMNIIEDLP